MIKDAEILVYKLENCKQIYQHYMYEDYEDYVLCPLTEHGLMFALPFNSGVTLGMSLGNKNKHVFQLCTLL